MNQKDFVYFDCSQQYISNKRQRIPKGNKKNGQPRETENIGYTRRRKTKQKHNTIRVGHHYNTNTNTNNVNKTCSLLQTTGVKDETNIVYRRKS